jgi:hypothetical protein
MTSVYKSSYSSASPGGDSAAHGKLRVSIKKAFQEAEQALLEWDEAQEHSSAVLDALTNAASRSRDFEAAEGNLGVLSTSKFPHAEKLLRVRLIQSMDRLLSSLHADLKLLENTCVKMEKVYENLLKDQSDMQVWCFFSLCPRPSLVLSRILIHAYRLASATCMFPVVSESFCSKCKHISPQTEKSFCLAGILLTATALARYILGTTQHRGDD